MAQRKRQRTESMIKLLNQRREARLWYEEANSHTKAGNLEKAIESYKKVVFVLSVYSVDFYVASNAEEKRQLKLNFQLTA